MKFNGKSFVKKYAQYKPPPYENKEFFLHKGGGLYSANSGMEQKNILSAFLDSHRVYPT